MPGKPAIPSNLPEFCYILVSKESRSGFLDSRGSSAHLPKPFVANSLYEIPI